MSKLNGKLQKFLLVLGILALLFLLIEIGASLAATQHGSTPARVNHVTAGPYRFTVSLYDDPARAGVCAVFRHCATWRSERLMGLPGDLRPSRDALAEWSNPDLWSVHGDSDQR